MKSILLFLLLLPLTLKAQQLFQKEMTYKSALSLTDIKMLPDNGFIACGNTESVIVDTTYAVVLRMDSVMNVLWCKSYNMLRKDNFRTITRLSDGNFIVGGTTKADFSSFYGASIYKIDGEGNVIWHKIFNNTADDATIGVFEQSDKSLVNIIRYGVTGKPTKIIHTDSSGNSLNQIRISAPENHGPVPDYVVSNGNGDFFMCGDIRNSTTNNFTIFILKANIAGVSWYKEYGFEGNNAFASGLDLHNNEELIISGIINQGSVNASKVVVMKVSTKNGNPLWAKEIQHKPAQNHYPFDIASVSHSKILLTGRFSNNLDSRAFGIKFDNNGNILWSNRYGEGLFSSIGFPLDIPGNRYLLTGKRTTDAGPYFILTDTAGNASCNYYAVDFISRDLTVTKYTRELEIDDPKLEASSPNYTSLNLSVDVNTICTGAVSVTTPLMDDGLILYPNPAKNRITIDMQDSFEPDAVLFLYNLQGDKVLSKTLSSRKSEIRLTLNPGIYFAEINSVKHTILNRKKVLVY